MSSTTKTGTMSVDTFRDAILGLLDETFDNVQGAYLDPGDSLFTTLEGVSAAQASVPVIGGENSIASQVNHIIFYFDVAIQYMRGENPGRQDWSQAWQLVSVSVEEWTGLREQLRDRQRTLVQLIRETPAGAFDHEDMVGGAIATIAHTAYHLGQVRHTLAFIAASGEE